MNIPKAVGAEALAELDLLSGADPSVGRIKDNPEDAKPLMAKIEGDKGYRGRLGKAASSLYSLLQSANPHDLPRRPPHGHLTALQILLHSLAHIASVPMTDKKVRNRYVAIPLRREDFSSGKEYDCLSYRAFKVVVDALKTHYSEDTGELWLDVIAAYHNRETGKGRRTRIRATEPFLDWMIQHGLIFAWHPHQVTACKAKSKASKSLVWVKYGKGKSDARPLDRPLQGDELFLPALNDALDRQKIECPLEAYSEYVRLYDFGQGKPRVSFGGNKLLYRQFSGQDGKGGRLYGHWVQSAPGDVRKGLKLGGKPVVELDYVSMQLALLYAIQGVPAPKGEDLYALPGMPPNRADMKTVLTVSVGTETRDEAIQAIRHELWKQNRKQDHAERLYDQFWTVHAAVCPHLQSDSTAAWADLQYQDSQVALRVLRKLLDQGITAIPIHDSFIVQARHETDLKAAMEQASEELAGTRFTTKPA